MATEKTTYHKTQADAVTAEAYFWTSVANPVNQPTSNIYKADKSIYLPEPYKSWPECWILFTKHYGSD